MKNIKYSYLLTIGIISMMLSCIDLDYENNTTINPENVWKNKNMINGFFVDIHGAMMPGWPYNGGESDEGLNSPGQMNDYLRGIIDVEKTGQKLNYTNIDKINFFLQKVNTVPENILSEKEKKQLMGQALFWRAWDYWSKVRLFGGVPLILLPQDVTNIPSLFIPRNKTSDCVTQIIKDLEDAIGFLPDKWDDANYGRIDKCAAMALKGKILMWYASPLFNPTNDKSRWETAYTANKEALAFARNQGKDLYPDFKELWYKERNQEVIMVNQFYYPDHLYSNADIRPEPITQSMSNVNQPYLPLTMAFPKKDGSTLNLEINKLSDPVYNTNFLKDFYTNRDDRFYTTIFCPGTIYPTPDFKEGVRYWNAWKKANDPSSPGGYKYVSIAVDQMETTIGSSISGFFQLKGLDKSLDKITVGRGQVDWIEIRFAEVLMNYGECANEVDKSNEALKVLYDIRKRANITSGDNNRFGVTANTQKEIREAYINERFVEFAFENKRFGDLRRWKRFDILNKHEYRAGIYVVLNDGEIQNNWTEDMNKPEVLRKYHAAYINNLDGDNKYKFNLSLNHWFYPISKDDLDRNSKLEQNNEWGGSFDPLQ